MSFFSPFKTEVGLVFVATDHGIKKTHITDSPLGERVYNHASLGGKKTLGLGVQGQHTRIKYTDFIDDESLKVESRCKVASTHFPETKQDGFTAILF
jgi:hypothetical protein